MGFLGDLGAVLQAGGAGFSGAKDPLAAVYAQQANDQSQQDGFSNANQEVAALQANNSVPLAARLQLAANLGPSGQAWIQQATTPPPGLGSLYQYSQTLPGADSNQSLGQFQQQNAINSETPLQQATQQYQLARAKKTDAQADQLAATQQQNAQLAGLSGDQFLAALQQIDPKRAQLALALARGDVAAPSLSRSVAGQQALSDAEQLLGSQTLNPGLNTTIKAYNDPNSKAYGEVKTLGTFHGHLGLMADAVSALNNGDIPAQNAIINTLKTQFGAPASTSANQILQLLSEEGQKYYAGSGGATEGAINLAMKNFPVNGSQLQQITALNNLNNLANSKQSQVQQQYDNTMNSYSRAAHPLQLDGPEAQAGVQKLTNLSNTYNLRQGIAPSVGSVINGYKYTGANPQNLKDQKNWVKS